MSRISDIKLKLASGDTTANSLAEKSRETPSINSPDGSRHDIEFNKPSSIGLPDGKVTQILLETHRHEGATNIMD